MQDYYNTIPAFGVGGLIEKIAKAAGRAKILSHANLLSKKQPELSKLLSKLAKSLKGDPKLSDKEADRLVTLAQDYRRSNINYLNRRKLLNKKIEEKANQLIGRINNAATSTRKATNQSANLSRSVQTATQEADLTTALQIRQNKFIGWVKKHPYISSGALLTLGTGPGRLMLRYTQMSPDDWGKDKSLEYIEINGQKYPIKRSIDGTPEIDYQDNLPKDDIDQAIDNAVSDLNNNQNIGLNTGNYQNYYQDQDSINELFSSDQW